MIKKLFFLAFLSVWAAKAQEPLERFTLLEAKIIGLGVDHQEPLTKTMLLDASLGMGITSIIYGDSYSFLMPFTPNLYTKVELREYYNRNRFTTLNKGNYIGIQSKVIATKKEIFMFNDIHWGIQRELSQKMVMSFHIGIGRYVYLHKSAESRIFPPEKYRKSEIIFSPSLMIEFKYILF